MPISLNSFTCSNGHTFTANAKLRTRCPDCGNMTKRSFAKPEPKPEEPPKPEPVPEGIKPEAPTTEPPKPKAPTLIRRGRERMPTARKTATPKEKPLPPKRTISKSKVAGGLVGKKRITTRGATPTISRPPKRTAVARGTVAGHEDRKPFWHGVADKYGI